jgi:uncharacterized protein YciI
MMPYFIMRCTHHPDQDSQRDAYRPIHRDWVGSGGGGLASVLIGSAFLTKHGISAGHWGILECADAAAAYCFATGDPFYQNGIVAEIEITPLPDTFQAHRISDRMS